MEIQIQFIYRRKHEEWLPSLPSQELMFKMLDNYTEYQKIKI